MLNKFIISIALASIVSSVSFADTMPPTETPPTEQIQTSIPTACFSAEDMSGFLTSNGWTEFFEVQEQVPSEDKIIATFIKGPNILVVSLDMDKKNENPGCIIFEAGPLKVNSKVLKELYEGMPKHNPTTPAEPEVTKPKGSNL